MKTRWILIIALVAGIVSAGTVSAQSCSSSKLSEYFLNDWSGEVTVSITLYKTSSGQHRCGTARVPAGFVLVGGGAWTDYTGSGALLTASFPLSDLRTWQAESKDLSSPDSHELYIQAIGLQLAGVSELQLRQHVELTPSSSLFAEHHPDWHDDPAAGYALIGGGARVNWSGAGNLLTASYPSGNRWYVKGKDHSTSSLATITAYAIGIKSFIPGFGNLDIQDVPNAQISIGSGPFSWWEHNSFGWVPACPGARSTWNSRGRLLTGMEIVGDDVRVRSKDHSVADGGTLMGYLRQIRKRP